MRNTTVANNNTAAAVGNWRMIVAQYTGTVGDSLRIGSTVVTGASAGVGDPGATWTWAARTTAVHADCSAWEFVIVNRTITAGEITSLIAYYNSLLPGSVTA